MAKRKTTDKVPVHTKDVTDPSTEGMETTVEQETATEMVEQEETVNEVTEEVVAQEAPANEKPVTEEPAIEEVTDQVEEEPEAEQEQPEVVVVEAEVTNTTEPTKVTGQTDPFLNSYYKRRIF